MTTRTRALLALTAVGLLGAASGAPALAAATAATGTGTSSVQILKVTAGGHTLALGGLSLVSDTVGGSPLAQVAVTPVVADSTAYGEQVITPADSPVTVPAQTSPAALAGIVSLTSPSFEASASNAPDAHVGSSSHGTVSLLGLAVPLTGGTSIGTAVSSTQALAQKTVTVKNLALPSIGAILAQLGLDLSKLPVGTLGSLVDQLDLVNDAITTAQAAVDSAQTQVNTATATATTAAAGLAQSLSAQTAATSALTAATAALQANLNQVVGATLISFPTANTIAGYSTLSGPGLAAVELLVPGTAASFSAYTAAQTALTTANAAVVTAQAAVDAAQAALATLTALLNVALGLVDDLASAVLDGTPLVSLDSLQVTSRAVASSAVAGGQSADVTGGSVEGLSVLGTDVLNLALGSSRIDAIDLIGANADLVNDVISDLTGTLSSVLSTLPGLALDIPAPTVNLLTKSTRTWVSGGYGRALASVTGLTITLPAVSIPTSLALPGAIDLPALTGVTQVAGLLTSAPISLELVTLSDQAAFAPGVVPGTTPPGTTPPGTTPPGAVPDLAATGMSVGVASFALLLLGAGLVLRRRHTHS